MRAERRLYLATMVMLVLCFAVLGFRGADQLRDVAPWKVGLVPVIGAGLGLLVHWVLGRRAS